MPLYEYLCLDCNEVTDTLRSMSEADDPIPCPECGSANTARKISLFSAHSDGKVVAGGGSPGCSSCQAGSCAGCGS